MTHSAPLFQRLAVLDIKKFNVYNIGLFMYKYDKGKLPNIFNNIFLKNSDVHDHFTKQSTLLHLPFYHTDYGQRSFRYQAVLICNNIYSELSVNVLIGTFKNHLKSYLLRQMVYVTWPFRPKENLILFIKDGNFICTFPIK